MNCGDPGLRVIFGNFISTGGTSEVQYAAGNHTTMPFSAVLFFETEQISFIIDASWETGGVQQHQSGECVDFGKIADGMSGERGNEPDRFVTEFFADSFSAAGGFVTFVEEEIQSLQNGFKAPRHFFGRGNCEGHAQIADALAARVRRLFVATSVLRKAWRFPGG
jgi:hypothetical protein